MKNVKRMLAFALALLTLAALPVAGLAADEAAKPEQAPEYLAAAAEVTETGTDWLLVKTEEGETVRLNTGDAWFVDNASGTPVDAGSVKAGDRIYCYTSAATTFSLPPQRAAICILTNVGKEDVPGHLLTVKSRTAETSCMALNCGNVILRVPFDAPVVPLRTRERLNATDLTVGTVLLAWYDVMTLSLPAQATADRVVVLDKAVHTVTVKTQDAGGVAVVPLRETAEALGFTVEWNAVERSVRMTDGVRQSTVTIGQDSYIYATAIPGMVGMTAPTSFGCVPAIDAQGRTWVPAAFFELLGAAGEAGSGTITFTYA